MLLVPSARFFYVSSLVLFIALTGICIVISAADIIIQSLGDRTDTGKFDYRNLVVVGGAYIILAIASFFLFFSRVLSVRRALQDIPKLNVPIHRDRLTSKMYTLIQTGFDHAQTVNTAAEPLAEDVVHVGRASPGSLLDGVDFKEAITKTPKIIEEAVKPLGAQYERQPHVTVRRFVEDLVKQGHVDDSLAQVYLRGYERARFSKHPVNEDAYVEVMRHLAAILGCLGYQIHAQPSQPNSSHSLLSSSSRSLASLQRLGSQRYDDDVVSLSQSIVTWSTRRSVRSGRSRTRPHSVHSHASGENVTPEEERPCAPFPDPDHSHHSSTEQEPDPGDETNPPFYKQRMPFNQ